MVDAQALALSDTRVVHGEVVAAGLHGPLTNGRRQEWMELSAADQRLVNADTIMRWAADLAEEDYSLADIARLERGRLQSLRTLREGNDLTELEFRFLRYLQRHERRTMSYLQIARHLWSTPTQPVTAATLRMNNGYANPMVTHIQVLVHTIRRKLEIDPVRPQHLATIRGVGYRWYSQPPALDDGENYDARATESNKLRGEMAALLGSIDTSIESLPADWEPGKPMLGPNHPNYGELAAR